MHGVDRYLIFVLAASASGRRFSLPFRRSSNLLWNFAQRFYYGGKVYPRKRNPFFRFATCGSLSLPFFFSSSPNSLSLSLSSRGAPPMSIKKSASLYGVQKSRALATATRGGFIVEKRVGTFLGTVSEAFPFCGPCAPARHAVPRSGNFPFLSSSGLPLVAYLLPPACTIVLELGFSHFLSFLAISSSSFSPSSSILVARCLPRDFIYVFLAQARVSSSGCESTRPRSYPSGL